MKLDTCVGRLFMSVCVATSPRLLIKVDASRTGQEATGPLTEQREHHTSALASAIQR